MSQEQVKAFFRNYSIVLGILAVLIVVFFFVARLVVPNDAANPAQGSSAAAENTVPVGQIRLTGEALALADEKAMEEVVSEAEIVSETVDPGKRVYSGLCFSCHGTGLPGIPQFGDKAAWATRIAQGKDKLYENALIGFTGASGMPMPAKGGNPSLSDDEVKAAVDYMIANAE
jgi:cytochrome c5